MSPTVSTLVRLERRGSYRLQDRFTDVEAELGRLEAQVENMWSKEADVLRRRGLPLDARVLEIGCGPGFVTERLLALVPNGSVTGLDNDPYMIEIAERRLSGRGRVQICEGSATETGLPSGSFDAATARLVFQHLPDPMAALSELRRVLRPGGRLFVTDSDSEWTLMLDPKPQGLEAISAALAARQAERGGDRRIGHRLPNLLADGGFSDLALDLVALHSAIDGVESITQMLGPVEALEPLVAAGLLTPEVYEEIVEYDRGVRSGELQVTGLLCLFVVSGAA